MRLRIVVGQPAAAAPGGQGLTEVFDRAPLKIEASADVARLATPGGGTLFVLGVPVRPSTAALADLSGDGLAHAAQAVEGRCGLVWIGADGTCEVAGDRFTQRDIYYQRCPGGVVIGTDLDLLPVSRDGDTFDQAAIAHAVCVFGWRPPKQHTFYTSVRRLGVGQRLAITGTSLTVVDDPFVPRATGDYGAAEHDEYAERLMQAVESRSSQKGNVVYLSSGWDSTAILACLVRLHGKSKVRGVIGRMQYANRSGVINQIEVDRATAIADYYGIQLDIAEFDYRNTGPELFDAIRPSLRAHNICGLGSLNHWHLAHRVAETANGDEAIFAGEISDGVHNLGFSQFLTIFHQSLEFREYSDKMLSYLYGPSFLSRFLDGTGESDPVYQIFRARAGGSAFDPLAEGDVARRRQLFSSFFLRANRLPLWSLRNSRFLTETGRATYADTMESTYLERAAREATPETLYAWYIHLYNSFHWQGSTVSTIAMTADLHGLRVEMPFWDSGLHDFLASMPESWGRGLEMNHTKYPLKWMLKHKIDYPYHLQVGPHSYLYDVNPTFSLAAEVLFASAFAPYLKSAMQDRTCLRLLDPTVFDLSHVNHVIDRYLAGHQADGAELSDLTLLCWMTAVGAYGV